MDSKKLSELIVRTAQKDGEALTELFQKYYPIVGKCRREYYLRGYDREDLDQEARLVLYRTACRFDPSRNAGFGTFYRLSLRNRFYDMIRTTNAKKRVPSEPLTSIEANETLYAATVADKSASSPLIAAIVDEAFKELSKCCWALEKEAFRLMLTEHDFSDLDPKTQRALANAFECCRRKFDGGIID